MHAYLLDELGIDLTVVVHHGEWQRTLHTTYLRIRKVNPERTLFESGTPIEHGIKTEIKIKLDSPSKMFFKESIAESTALGLETTINTRYADGWITARVSQYEVPTVISHPDRTSQLTHSTYGDIHLAFYIRYSAKLARPTVERKVGALMKQMRRIWYRTD